MSLTKGYHVVLENSHGNELTGRFASTAEDISPAIISLVSDSLIEAGDVIRVIEVEPKAVTR